MAIKVKIKLEGEHAKKFLRGENPGAQEADVAKHWMQGAVKRKGALTAKAHAAGESPMEFAEGHAHSPGLTGQQSRFALIAQGKPVPGGKKKKHAGLPRAAGR